jgi:hypothetical protein
MIHTQLPKTNSHSCVELDIDTVIDTVGVAIEDLSLYISPWGKYFLNLLFGLGYQERFRLEAVAKTTHDYRSAVIRSM